MPINFKGVPNRIGSSGQFWQLVDPVNDRYGWATGGGGGGGSLLPTVQTTNYTASVNDFVICNAAGNITVTLPTAPVAGAQVAVEVVNPTGGAFVVPGGTDTIRGYSPNLSLPFTTNWVLFTYNVSGTTWESERGFDPALYPVDKFAAPTANDWLPQYALIAGRAGTQSWTMSNTTIGNLNGSSIGTTAAALHLRADSSNAAGSHLGNIFTLAPIHMFETSVAGSANETLTADPGAIIQARGNKTLNFATASFGLTQGIYCWRGSLLYNQSPTANPASVAFKAAGTYTNVSGTAIASLGANSGFNSAPTYQADGAAVTFAATADVFSGMTFKTINAGTLTAATDWVNFEAQVVISDSGCTMTGSYAAFSTFAPTITAGSMVAWTGFRVLAGTYNTQLNIGVEIRTMTGGAAVGSQSGISIAAITAGAGTTNQVGVGVGPVTGGSGTNIGVDIAAPSGGTAAIGLRSAGSVLHTGTGGIGYTVGAGGSVTQLTSRTTGVTINKVAGAITLFSAAGVTTWTTFTVTNSTVGVNDTIDLAQQSGTNLYQLMTTAVTAGTFNISFATTGGTATDAPVILFTINKGTIT